MNDVQGWWKPGECARFHYFSGQYSLCKRYLNLFSSLLDDREIVEKCAKGARLCKKCQDIHDRKKDLL